MKIKQLLTLLSFFVVAAILMTTTSPQGKLAFAFIKGASK
jgi:hypothetical protein